MDQTETLIIRQQKEDSPFYIFLIFAGRMGKQKELLALIPLA